MSGNPREQQWLINQISVPGGGQREKAASILACVQVWSDTINKYKQTWKLGYWSIKLETWLSWLLHGWPMMKTESSVVTYLTSLETLEVEK